MLRIYQINSRTFPEKKENSHLHDQLYATNSGTGNDLNTFTFGQLYGGFLPTLIAKSVACHDEWIDRNNNKKQEACRPI